MPTCIEILSTDNPGARFAVLSDIYDPRLYVAMGLSAPLLVTWEGANPALVQLPARHRPSEQHWLNVCAVDGSMPLAHRVKLAPAQWQVLDAHGQQYLEQPLRQLNAAAIACESDPPQASQPGDTLDRVRRDELQQARQDLFFALCRFMDGRTRDEPASSWQIYLDLLERERYAARAQFGSPGTANRVQLFDRLVGRAVVTLEGQALEDALDSGFLTEPKFLMPSDADWLVPLMDYAREHDLIHDVRVQATAGPAVPAPFARPYC